MLILTLPLMLLGRKTLIAPSLGVAVPATVPGSVYTDLMRAGVIGDPYARFNDVNYRWVALDNWTYTRTFNGKEISL